MKWNRATHHLESLAATCADMATGPGASYSLRVVEMWAFGDVLDGIRDLDNVRVALAVDLPVDEVPWLGEPAGAQHWAYATRLIKNPIIPLWRSVHAPIWNHYIDRPVLLWSVADGPVEPALAAVRAGDADPFRLPAPTPERLRDRLADELAVSLRELRARNHDYDERRWRPGKLEPVADALWRASNGYLDVLDAMPPEGADQPPPG